MLAQHSTKFSTCRATLRRNSFGAVILRRCLYIMLMLAAGAMQLNAQNLHVQFNGNDLIGLNGIENNFWPEFGNELHPSTTTAWPAEHLNTATEKAFPEIAPIGLQSLKSQAAPHLANEMIAGIPSQAVQFASWATAAGQFVEQQIRQASLVYEKSDGTSDLDNLSLVGQLDTKVHPAAWLSTPQSSDHSATLFHVDTVTDDMVTDDTVKDVLGGQSGFFFTRPMGREL